jgi:hypothetical protein
VDIVVRRIEPVIAHEEAGALTKAFLFEVAVREKHWPADEVRTLLDRDSILVAAFDEYRVAGAAQILYERPFPCERPPFSFQMPDDGRRPCEVSLIAVAREYRRSASHSASVVDALVKGLYGIHANRGGTHIYTLCEDWTFSVLTDAYAKIPGRKVSPGFHYWCGTTACPGPHCQPTSVCELDMREAEKRWAAERPNFWAYVTNVGARV